MVPILTVEYHGEGIVEFHCAVPEQNVTWKGIFLLVLPGFAVVFVVWALSIASGWDLVSVWISICLVLVWKKLGQVKKESLLLMHDLGIQVKRSYVSGKEDNMFVERSRLSSVVINEGVGFSAVTYYLAFITQGDLELVLAFSQLIPRINDLIVILHATRSVIFGEDVPDWHTAAKSLNGPQTSSYLAQPPRSRQLFSSFALGAGAVGDAGTSTRRRLSGLALPLAEEDNLKKTQ